MGDAQGQHEVLRAAIEVLEKAEKPGEIHHLPFTWPEEPKDAKWHPPEQSPLIKMFLDQIKKARREEAAKGK